MNVEDFRNYMANNFSNEVVSLINCDNRIYQKYLQNYNEFYEGTIRAAIWSVLRNKLPEDWFVQAECQYPVRNGDSNDRADIVVWSPDEKSFVFEVKPFVGIDVIKNDITKLKNYLNNNIEQEQIAYMIFTTIYKQWIPEEWPKKDWNKCEYCKKYNIGGAMPWGYGDCPNCDFTEDTLNYLKEENIEIIPLFFEIK